MEASVESLITKIKSFPALQQRCIAAVVGGVVADCASRPLHWIYDQKKLKKLVGEKNPEFWPENQCPYYTVPTGGSSCYSDGIKNTVRFLAANKKFENTAFQQAIAEFYGSENSIYQVALRERQSKKHDCVPGPWLNGSVIKFLENYKSKSQPVGHPSTMDNDGYANAFPVFVFQLLKSKKDQAEVEKALSNICANEKCMNYYRTALNITEAYITDPQVDVVKTVFATEKVNEIKQNLEEVVEQQGESNASAVSIFGLPCGNPGAFLGAQHSILNAQDYVSGVRTTIVSAGDNCARNLFVGTTLGAKFGIDSIPVEWIKQSEGHLELLQQLISLVE